MENEGAGSKRNLKVAKESEESEGKWGEGVKEVRESKDMGS